MRRPVPLIVGLAALALYLSLPSQRHNFDGVACAVAVELGDLRHLVHGNHLAYGLVGLAFHRWAGSHLGLNALWSLQVMDSLLGALAAGLFARLLLERGRAPAVAAAAGLGLAASNAWWLRSLDAQVYLLAAPFLVLALGELLAERPRAGRLGLLHLGAMLVHASHVLLAPAAVWSLWRAYGDSEEGRAALSRYLALCLAGVLAAYAAALALCVRPASVEEVRLWLLGSMALEPDRAPRWLTGSSELENLRYWARSALRVAAVKPWLGLGLWGLAAWGWAAGERRERAVAGLWLGAYALLFIHWEPWNIDYRIPDLLPLWLAAAALPWRPVALCAAVLGAANLAWGLWPVSRRETNLPLQKTLWLGATLPADAWVAARSIEEVYIPYFTGRRTLNLRWLGAPGRLEERVAELLAAGEPVYVTSDHWEPAFEAFAREEVSRNGDLVLYRLKGKPKGSL